MSAATHENQEAADSPPARAHAPWPFAPLLRLRALLRVKTRAPSFRPIPARGQSCPQQRTKTKRRPTTHQHARTRLGLSHPSCTFGRCCGLTTRAPSLRPIPARGQSCPQQRTKTKRPPTAHQHARTRLGLSHPSCTFGRCCGLTTRAPSFRPIPARGQSCPQQRTKTKRPPDSPPARAHAPWPFAPLLHLRALLRVNNPRSVIRGQSRRADSLVRSNARKPRGGRQHHQHARTRLGLSHPSCTFGRCCGLTTRAPSLWPIPARGQSCPQQRTKTKRRPTAHQHARTRLGLSHPSCPFGRCCGLKPALRHCGQSRRADSLVRSNARKPRGARHAHQHARERALAFRTPSCPFGRCCGLKPALRHSLPIPARGQSCPQQRTKPREAARQATSTRARALAFRTPLAPSGVAAG